MVLEQQKLSPEQIEAAALATVKSRKPAAIKHPLRYSIAGDTHFTKDLKEIIRARDAVSDSLKQFLCAELDAIQTNAAEIHLQVVDHRSGGISLNLHITPRHLGQQPAAGHRSPAAARKE